MIIKTRSNSIKNKIVTLTVGLISMLLVSSLVSLFSMKQIGQELESIAEYDIPITRSLTNVTIHQLEQAIHFERAVHHGEVAGLSGQQDKLTELEAEIKAFENFSKMVELELEQTLQMVEHAASTTRVESEKIKFGELAGSLQGIRDKHQDYAAHSKKAFMLLRKMSVAQAQVIIRRTTHEQDELDHELETLLIEVEVFTEKAGIAAEIHEQQAEALILAILIASMIMGPLLGWLVFKSIKFRLTTAGQRINRIAEGDLSEEFSDQDEISVPLREMQYRLREMVGILQSSIVTLATTSSQVTGTTEQNSETADEQQKQIQQIAAAMTEINASIEDVSRNIDDAANESRQANSEAESGCQVVRETAEIVNNLFNQIDDASSVVQQVEQDSININTVLEVIVSIAEQINLLALNAAIEAARAGEQGRGFAVVADEVRSLAGRTQESTEEIRLIIEQLQKRTSEAASVMSKSQDQSRLAVEQANSAGKSLESISAAISRISQGSSEISHAADEQLTAVSDITRNVHTISELSVRNSTGAQETLDAVNHLALMSVELQDISSQFKGYDCDASEEKSESA